MGIRRQENYGGGKQMKDLIIAGISFIVGFVGAYGFDAFLQWRDDRKWR
jgi:hypothetical protein